MISCTNVSVTINSKTILHKITCIIEKGDFIVIVGPNGAGKSTFFDMLSGSKIPSKGTITYNGTNITRYTEQKRSAFISRLFQNPQLNGSANMTVAENLAMSNYKGNNATLSNGMNRFPMHIVDDLNLLNLNSEKILTTPMENLSGGQRQLLAFIMATAQPPQLFLLDEPTAALDPASATKLLQFALKYIDAHAMTTVLITHDPELALTIGRKIWILENGTITKQYNQDEHKNLSAADLIGHIDYKNLR